MSLCPGLCLESLPEKVICFPISDRHWSLEVQSHLDIPALEGYRVLVAGQGGSQGVIRIVTARSSRKKQKSRCNVFPPSPNRRRKC